MPDGALVYVDTGDNAQLRVALSGIFADAPDVYAWRESHEAQLLALRLPHTVSLYERAPRDDEHECVSYGLGLDIDEIRYSCNSKIYPRPAFVDFLLKQKAIVPRLVSEGAKADDIVIYRSKGKAGHVGRWAGSAVISKFGASHVWLHALFEVPESYGNEILFYRPPVNMTAWFEFWAGTGPPP